MTILATPSTELVILGVLPMALGLSLSASDTAGPKRVEALLKVTALVWGLVIGLVYYGIFVVIAIPGIIAILYEGLTDTEPRYSQGMLDWITGLSYWESDNYAYAFGDRDEPAWLPDTEQSR